MSEADYRANLMHLPPVTRERLMNGDWTVAESLQIPETWFRYYSLAGDMLRVIPIDNKPPACSPVNFRSLQRFATIDTAGTSRDKAEESRGKPPSWSCIGIWDYWRATDLLCLHHVWRERVAWNELKARTPQILNAHNCRSVDIENAHVGQPLADELTGKGFQVNLVGPTLPGMADGWRGAKLERAIASGLLERLEAGKLLLPQTNQHQPWLPLFEGELTAWSGSPDETCDQIDMSSYACWRVKNGTQAWGGVIRGR